ncbi:MAG: zinc ribbon domain-containing protein [Clostridiaceae bacterium]
MERPAKSKKLYQSASYVTSNAVFYGTLLFFISRVFGFFQLFVDAYNRKQLGQAPPENFTVFGIIGSVLVLGVITGAFLLLVQYRQKKLRLRKGNFYLLLNLLFVAWGLIQAITYLVEMILFFEFVYMLDFLTLLAALALPSVLLQLADRRQEPAQDKILLYAGIGSTALSAVAALIVALVLRKSYTAFQLVRELMFRGGIILFGVGGLQKALKLRSEPLPAYTPKPDVKKPEPKKTVLRQPVYAPDKSGKIECPDCGKKMAAGTATCPRCGYDMNTPSLFDDDEEETAPSPAPEAEAPVFEPEPETPPAPAPEVKSDLCPRCGKKIPEPLVTCPRCGYYPGDSLEMPREPEKRTPAPEAKPRNAAPRQERLCTRCGKKIPGGLATCPYCGFHPADEPEETPGEEPEEAEETYGYGNFSDQGVSCPRCDNTVARGTRICPHCGYPFPDETARHPRPTQPKLPRVPDPKHLTEKNSIECPECGRRYPASRSVCPYCGYSLYED